MQRHNYKGEAITPKTPKEVYMRIREYFKDSQTAWKYAELLPKTRYTVTDYGKDDSRPDSPYYIEYIDRPAYTR